MLHKKTIYLILVFFFLSYISCTNKPKSEVAGLSYTPDDQELYDTIVSLDRIFFNAYNTCDLATQGIMYSEKIEFYHDQSGLMTSKDALLEATKENICGKVTRELVEGSIEVYQIKGFGAIEIGQHKFHNNQEDEDVPSKVGKFIMIWQKMDTDWKITKVISIH